MSNNILDVCVLIGLYIGYKTGKKIIKILSVILLVLYLIAKFKKIV